jgi:DNA-binding SARP family transcriptional activator
LRVRQREFDVVLMLAIARVPMSGETLSKRCWPNLAYVKAAAALRTTIHRLRGALGDRGAIVHEGGYRLAESVRVDLKVIEQRIAAFRAHAENLTAAEVDEIEKTLRSFEEDLPYLYSEQKWVFAEPRLRRIRRDLRRLLHSDDANSS